MIIDLPMPSDFPTSAFTKSYWLVHAKKDGVGNAYWHFANAWKGVQYRFLSCSQHDQEYTQSVMGHTISPPMPERWQQEHHLFAFFFTGFSVLENIHFGLHAIGSMIDSGVFKMASAQDLRLVTPELTRDRFLQKFPSEALSSTLQEIIASTEFKEWKAARNSLSHRGNPGRTFSLGKASTEEAIWLDGIALDASSTNKRRAWLSSTAKHISTSLDAFLISHL